MAIIPLGLVFDGGGAGGLNLLGGRSMAIGLALPPGLLLAGGGGLNVLGRSTGIIVPPTAGELGGGGGVLAPAGRGVVDGLKNVGLRLVTVPGGTTTPALVGGGGGGDIEPPPGGTTVLPPPLLGGGGTEPLADGGGGTLPREPYPELFDVGGGGT